MTGDEIDDRIDVLARVLAASRDATPINIAALRAICAELVSISLAARALGHRECRALRRRAVDLRRDAEVAAGSIPIAMKASGELRDGPGGDTHSEAGRARLTLVQLGFTNWNTASRWMDRARKAGAAKPRRRKMTGEHRSDGGDRIGWADQADGKPQG
jgi:hypothetical protein